MGFILNIERTKMHLVKLNFEFHIRISIDSMMRQASSALPWEYITTSWRGRNYHAEDDNMFS